MATLAKFLGEKALLRGNLIFCISGTEGRRKLQFGEVGLQICEKILRKIAQKNFRPERPFYLHLYSVSMY